MPEWAQHETGVDFIAGQIDFLSLRSDIFQCEVDVGIKLDKFAHDGRHDFSGGKGHVADAQPPTFSFCGNARGLHCAADLRVDQPGLFMEDLARRGERHFAGGAADQLEAQLLLELTDAARQGALVDGHPFRSTAKAQLRCHQIEHFDIAQAGNLRHGWPLCRGHHRAAAVKSIGIIDAISSIIVDKTAIVSMVVDAQYRPRTR
jgi:hypothetical protein